MSVTCLDKKWHATCQPQAQDISYYHNLELTANPMQQDTKAHSSPVLFFHLTHSTKLQEVKMFHLLLYQSTEAVKKRYTEPFLSLICSETHPNFKSSNTKGSYLLLSSAAALQAKKMSVVGMEGVRQVSGLEAVVALVSLLMCWNGAAAAADLSWLGCRPVLKWHCLSLLQPQESRCQLARSVQGHGAHCPLGCHLYSTPGWSHCGHHSLMN